eukprot:Hpha_TRINITY_DN15770_c6_g7::TRINITY_DN15770_c6_g7_i1::g.41373::m.41373
MSAPASWSVEDVVAYLAKNGCSEVTIKACESNEVDGKALLGLTKTDIKDELSIASIGERKRLWGLVESLTTAAPSERAQLSTPEPSPQRSRGLHTPRPDSACAGSPSRALRKASLAESATSAASGLSEPADLDALEEWSKRLWADEKMRQQALVEAAQRQARRESIARREQERQKAEELRIQQMIQREASERYEEKEAKLREEERIAEAGKRLRSRRSLTPTEHPMSEPVPSWKARELAEADALAKDKIRARTPAPISRPTSAAEEAQKAREMLRAEERQARLVRHARQHRDAVFDEERRRRAEREGLDAAERNRREAMKKEMRRRQEAAAFEAARRLPPMHAPKTVPDVVLVPGTAVRTAIGDAWIVDKYSGANPNLKDFWWVEMEDGVECLFAATGVAPRRGGAVRS